MARGEFRDASAALERAHMLEEQVAALKEENALLNERVERLLEGLDKNKLSGALKKAIEERAALQREMEDKQRAHIVVVQKMTATAKAREQELEAERADREARLDPTTKAWEDALLRQDPTRVSLKLAEVIKERDAFAIRLATGLETEETNVAAFVKRVVEERDEVLRELHQLRASPAPRPKGPGLLGRVLERLFGVAAKVPALPEGSAPRSDAGSPPPEGGPADPAKYAR